MPLLITALPYTVLAYPTTTLLLNPTLPYTTLRYSKLPYTILHYSTKLYTTLPNSTLLYPTLHNPTQLYTTLPNTTQPCTSLPNTITPFPNKHFTTALRSAATAEAGRKKPGKENEQQTQKLLLYNDTNQRKKFIDRTLLPCIMLQLHCGLGNVS